MDRKSGKTVDSQPRVTLVQMVSSADVAPNLERAEALILEAASHRPDAIFLPENFAALASADPRAIGSREAGNSPPVQELLSSLSKQAGCYLFAGTLPHAARPDGSAVPGNRVRAASLVYSPQGECVSRYDKMHMFDVDVSDNQGAYRESATFERGDTPVVVQTPFARIGLSVCYDLRFPEFYRQLFAADADLVAVPSAFTRVTGEAHFEVLMRARAIENTCFMLAACQGGNHDSGRQTWGHSMVVSPWGEVLGELDTGEGLLTVDLDLSQLDQIRREMPFRSQQVL